MVPALFVCAARDAMRISTKSGQIGGVMMLVGAYWPARQESRDEATTRIMAFLGPVAAEYELLSRWFLKGRTGAEALSRSVSLDATSISRLLRVQQREVAPRTVMAELGFRLSLWNGGDAGFSAAIGMYSPKLSNNAILSLPADGVGISKEALRDLLVKLVLAFEPERGVVTSHQLLKQHGARKPWEVGWITYERSSGLKDHPIPS